MRPYKGCTDAFLCASIALQQKSGKGTEQMPWKHQPVKKVTPASSKDWDRGRADRRLDNLEQGPYTKEQQKEYIERRHQSHD